MSIRATLLKQQALEKFSEGELDAAYDILQQAISESDPDDTEILELALDFAYRELGNLEDAVNYANAILLQTPENRSVRTKRGWTYYDINRYDEALADFEEVIEASDDADEINYARSGRALSLYGLGRSQEAIPDFEWSCKIYPEWAIGFAHLGFAYYLQQEYPQALTKFEQAIAISKDATYHFAHSGRGLALYELGEYADAIEEISIGLADNQNWSQGYATRGWCYLNVPYYQDKYEKALADFNKAITLQESPYLFAYAGRGVVYYERRNYEEAAADLALALTENQTWIRGLAIYGWCLVELTRYEEAIEPLTTALNLADGDYAYAQSGRGVANFELYHLDEAKTDLEAVLEENDEWYRGRAILGWVYYELAQSTESFEHAYAYFDNLIVAAPTYGYAYAGRGLCAYMLDNNIQAIADITAALPDNPTWLNGYKVLANAYRATDDREACLDTYAKMLTLPNVDADSFLRYGALYEEISDYRMALSIYQKGMKIERQDGKDKLYCHIGNLYLHGLGTIRNYKAAFSAFNHLGTRGELGEVAAPLINCYHQGIGTKKSPDNVLALIDVALNQKNESVDFLLLMAYFSYHGLYMDKSIDVANAYVNQALLVAPKQAIALYYQVFFSFKKAPYETTRQIIAQLMETLDLLPYQKYKKDEIVKQLRKQNKKLIYPLFEKPWRLL